ncbi:MAG TPA: hypothetical protein VFJ24_01640 [Gaiellales bacterium]|nr:hypothetical protein [Gaiellales bacterium]
MNTDKLKSIFHVVGVAVAAALAADEVVKHGFSTGGVARVAAVAWVYLTKAQSLLAMFGGDSAKPAA